MVISIRVLVYHSNARWMSRDSTLITLVLFNYQFIIDLSQSMLAKIPPNQAFFYQSPLSSNQMNEMVIKQKVD